jgi:hypothetical protein
MNLPKILAAFVFCILAAFTAGESRAQGYCDPAYSFLPAGALPLATFEVGEASRVVALEYTPYFGPLAYPIGNGVVPQLGQFQPDGTVTYDSGGCDVLGQHARWFMNMGVEAVVVDVTNAVRCMFMSVNENVNTVGGCAGQFDRLQRVRQNVENMYAYYAAHNVPIRIIPVLGGQGDELTVVLTDDGKVAFVRALDFFERMSSQYPNHAVRYRGKPLIMVYVGTPYAHEGTNYMDLVANTIAGAGKQGSFTYRISTGFTESQAPLWDVSTAGLLAGLNRIVPRGFISPSKPAIPYPVWSYFDRFSGSVSNALIPTYAVDAPGGKPENLVITTAFPGSLCGGPGQPVDCWLASDARTRGVSSSAVLDDYMVKAKALQPRFLIINQFNEYGYPDEGFTRDKMMDVEPTVALPNGQPGWGNTYMDLLTTKIAEYKNALTRPIDLSTRLFVGGGNNLAITGFTIAGPLPKKVLIRGFGPSLAVHFGSGALANPRLDLSTPTGWISNDDWQQAPNAGEIAALGLQPGHALESALLVTLYPGTYTALMQGVAGSVGIGLIEVYEIDNPGSPFAGISTRGYVGTGNNQMIAGLIIGGTQPQTVLIRVAGPSLYQYGLTGVMDPSVTLISNGVVVASNDNWQQASNWPQIQAAGAPRDSRESAILITLNPGAYTAVVSGVNGAQGIGLIEVYTQ